MIQCPRIATGEVGPRSAGIGHEQRITDEGRITDDVCHAGRRVARGVYGASLQVANAVGVAITKKMVEL